MALGALKALAQDMGMAPGRKAVTPAIEAASGAFTVCFIGGFVDADASIQGTQVKGVSIRLAQSDAERLAVVQRMLLRLGIVSTIYPDQRPAGETLLPDGRGGRALYPTGPQHELVIANENVHRFAALIGFADTDKRAKLDRSSTA
jgi:ribonucleoside-diphosphate reductase alpha chain